MFFAIIEAMLAGQVARSYEISPIPSTVITIAIALILWYGLNFIAKRKNND
jgi:hypothetical protein